MSQIQNVTKYIQSMYANQEKIALLITRSLQVSLGHHVSSRTPYGQSKLHNIAGYSREVDLQFEGHKVDCTKMQSINWRNESL